MPKTRAKRACMVPGCPDPLYRGGLCRGHFESTAKGKAATAAAARERDARPPKPPPKPVRLTREQSQTKESHFGTSALSTPAARAAAEKRRAYDAEVEAMATPPLPGTCKGCEARVELHIAQVRWMDWGMLRPHRCAT